MNINFRKNISLLLISVAMGGCSRIAGCWGFSDRDLLKAIQEADVKLGGIIPQKLIDNAVDAGFFERVEEENKSTSSQNDTTTVDYCFLERQVGNIFIKEQLYKLNPKQYPIDDLNNNGADILPWIRDTYTPQTSPRNKRKCNTFTRYRLDCVNFKEPFINPDGFEWDSNELRIENRRSPYVSRGSIENDSNGECTFRSYATDLVVVDHLLKDDTCLIELPEWLHTWKTAHLDKLIPCPLLPDRTLYFTPTYWSQRKNTDSSSNICFCGLSKTAANKENTASKKPCNSEKHVHALSQKSAKYLLTHNDPSKFKLNKF